MDVVTNLSHAINAALQQTPLRCHVPGHAGRWLGSPDALLSDSWFKADVTELEGLDVLSEPEGCLAAAQQAYADACKVSQSFFLTNGSTAGILASMLACGLTEADTVLVARNAHRSVMSGLILTGATPAWFYPTWESTWALWHGVTASHLPATPPPWTKAVIVTSPTYEGMASDIPAIAHYCQQHQLYLIVDEAHGALWPFHPGLPLSACQVPGVDAVVQSCHKTMGSLTQTAVLHVPVGSRLRSERVQQSINLVQTSSPSYPLLLSLDAIRAHWQQHPAQLDRWLTDIAQLRASLHEIPHLTLWPSDDPSRLVIQYQPFSQSNVWAVQLEARDGIPYEALTAHAAVYVWGVGLTRTDSTRFIQAFKQLPCYNNGITPDVTLAWNHAWPVDTVVSPRSAFFSPGVTVDKAHAVGRIAQQTIVHCPPGIPVLSHGERIHPHHLPFLPQHVCVLAQCI
jgi:arginine decarboxylase